MSEELRVLVAGIGGMGNNFTNYALMHGLTGIDTLAIDTDEKVIALCRARKTLLIGAKATGGKGAEGLPEKGQSAAVECEAQIRELFVGVDILFLVCGLGGGTGTGAAPVIGKIAGEMKIQTVCIAVEPFRFEAKKRIENAGAGKEALKKTVDALFLIRNDSVLEVVDRRMDFPKAIESIDVFILQVFEQIVKGMSHSVTTHGGCESFRNWLRFPEKAAYVGIGRAGGKGKMLEAARNAVTSSYLEYPVNQAFKACLFVSGDVAGEAQETESMLSLWNSVTKEIDADHAVLEENRDSGEVLAIVIEVMDK